MALDGEGVQERERLRQLVRKWASDYCREWFPDQSKRFEYSLAYRCLVQLGDAAIADGIDGEWPLVVAAVLAGLFVLESLWAVIVFPFAWRRQIVRNKKIAQLLTDMNGVYSEMSSSGPISARHIRERAQDVSARGVVWPAPLFALLDDIIGRTGRM